MDALEYFNKTEMGKFFNESLKHGVNQVYLRSELLEFAEIYAEYKLNCYNKNNVWYDINDRNHPLPNECDFLVKLESGKIFRYMEDWSENVEIVTHWKELY